MLLGILVLILYSALMVGATVLFTRKTNNAESFHVADRNIGTLVSALSIAATWIWAPSLFVSGQQAYQSGFPGFLWFLVPNVLCLMLFIPFARRIRARYPQGITLLGGRVPIVKVHHDDQAGDIYGTVTHNRARGTHLLEPMKAIVKRLMDEGKEIKEISKQLGMRPEEVFRLSDFDKEDFLRMMAKGTTEYSNAEILRKL